MAKRWDNVIELVWDSHFCYLRSGRLRPFSFVSQESGEYSCTYQTTVFPDFTIPNLL